MPWINIGLAKMERHGRRGSIGPTARRNCRLGSVRHENGLRGCGAIAASALPWAKMLLPLRGVITRTLAATVAHVLICTV